MTRSRNRMVAPLSRKRLIAKHPTLMRWQPHRTTLTTRLTPMRRQDRPKMPWQTPNLVTLESQKYLRIGSTEVYKYLNLSLQGLLGMLRPQRGIIWGLLTSGRRKSMTFSVTIQPAITRQERLAQKNGEWTSPTFLASSKPSTKLWPSTMS